MTDMTYYLQYGLMASHIYADYLQPNSIVERKPEMINNANGISAFNVNAGLGPGWDIATVDMPMFMLSSGQSSFDVRREGSETPNYYSGGAVDSVYWRERVWLDQSIKTSPADNPYLVDKNSAQMNGFYARVYIKEEGGVKKAVIAVEGSETMSYSLGRPNNPTENIRDANLDWFGNDFPAVLGTSIIPQTFPAYHFAKWAIEGLEAADIHDISFTGHSLGGAVASILGVLFRLR